MEDEVEVRLPAKIKVNIGDKQCIYTPDDFDNPLDYISLYRMCMNSRPVMMK